MLIHQNYTSEGSAPAAVHVTDRTVDNELFFGGACHSGIKLGSDGVLSTIQNNGGFSAIIGEWLLSGGAAGFFVQRTIISGTLEVDPGGGFLQLNADRTYDNQSTTGTKITEVFFEFSSDIGGTPIVATVTHIYISTR